MTARIRSLKPEIWLSHQVMNLSHGARLLFIGLITQSDDEGRGSADARRLKATVFPGDDVAMQQVASWMSEIAEQRLVRCFHADNHGDLYELPTWRNHQAIDRPKASRYPPFADAPSNDRRSVDEAPSNDRRHVDDTSPDPRLRGDQPCAINREGSEGIGSEQSVPPERDRELIDRIFEHWKNVHEAPKAKLDAKRTKTIRSALKSYTADDLCRAINGYKLSPFHMGQNDRRTEYSDIGLLLRDAQHIEEGLRLAEHGAAV